MCVFESISVLAFCLLRFSGACFVVTNTPCFSSFPERPERFALGSHEHLNRAVVFLRSAVLVVLAWS
jgi:hypothetical protein